MKSRVIVAAIIENKDYVLFGKKAKDIGPYPNKWLILGGGVNLGEEHIKDALKREIREEGNIEIKDIVEFDFDEGFVEKKGEKIHHIFLNYIAKYDSGELKPGDDIQELKWVHKSKIKELDMCEPSIRLFKKIGYI